MIRPARLADAAAVSEIWNTIIRDTMITFTTRQKPNTEIADVIAQRGPAFLVAEQHGVVCGFASYGPFREGPGYRHVAEHTLYVADFARGSGVGRALLQQLESVAEGQGIEILIAGISGANPAAEAFHDRMGFETVGRMPGLGRKAGQRIDLVLMQKNLSKIPHPQPDRS